MSISPEEYQINLEIQHLKGLVDEAEFAINSGLMSLTEAELQKYSDAVRKSRIKRTKLDSLGCKGHSNRIVIETGFETHFAQEVARRKTVRERAEANEANRNLANINSQDWLPKRGTGWVKEK